MIETILFRLQRQSTGKYTKERQNVCIFYNVHNIIEILLIIHKWLQKDAIFRIYKILNFVRVNMLAFIQ